MSLTLNGVPVEVTRFPDGTSQVWKFPENLIHDSFKETNFVEWKFTQESDLLHLAQLKALLDNSVSETYLKIKYLPYGRQDKFVSNNATFALLPFAKLLNSLKFNTIEIVDPHSNIALVVIDNSFASYPRELINTVRVLTNTDIYCYPDKGAVTKYTKIYDMPHIYGNKVRDQLTGFITSYEVVGECKDKKVLIVDDICDGGMTFKLLAQDLLKAGAKEVNLFVSHGLFTQGLKTLKESGINKIFCIDGEVTEVKQQLAFRTLEAKGE